MARQPITIKADVFVNDVYRPGFTLSSYIKDDRNDSVYDEVFWDPRMGTVFLKPVQLRPEWSTTGTGDYARIRKASMTCSDAGFTHWEEVTRRFSSDYFMAGKNPTDTDGEVITFTDSLAANRGMFLEFFVYGAAGHNYEITRITFGAGSPVKYDFRMWTDSYYELYKSGVLEGWGYMNPDHRIATGVLQRLMIMPLRRNQILFWAGECGSYLYEDEDLDYANTDNVITAASNPTIQFPTGKALFALSYLTFPAEGTIRGPVSLLPYTPTAAASYTSMWEKDLETGTAVSLVWKYATDPDLPDPSTDAQYTCDGAKDNAYYYIVMASSNKTHSPTVYRVAMIVTEEIRSPYTGTDDLTPLVTKATLRVGEPGQTMLDMELKDPEDIDGIDRITNVQVSLEEGDDQWFAGFTQSPTFEPGPGGADRLRVGCMDWWKQVMNTRLTSEQAFDGQLHHEVIELLAGKCGFGGFVDIDDDVVNLPYANRDDEFAFQPENGEPIAEFMQRIRDEFSQWDLDTKPTQYWSGSVQSNYHYALCYKNPSTAYTISKATFDPTASGSGTTGCVNKITREHIAPEANEVWVIGFDSQERPIVSYYVDYDSQDSTIAPAARPTNWTGERWPVIYIHPGLRTLTDVQFVCSMLALRTTLARERVEFEAQWVPEATRNDWVFVVGDGFGYYQVESFEVEFAIESENSAVAFNGLHRPARYSAIRFLDPDPDSWWNGVYDPR
jgi:hypothetical protein